MVLYPLIGVLQMDTERVLQLLNFRPNFLCVESGVRNVEGVSPSLADRDLGERREFLQRGPGRSPGRQRIFGIFEVHRTLLVERTLLLY